MTAEQWLDVSKGLTAFRDALRREWLGGPDAREGLILFAAMNFNGDINITVGSKAKGRRGALLKTLMAYGLLGMAKKPGGLWLGLAGHFLRRAARGEIERLSRALANQ